MIKMTTALFLILPKFGGAAGRRTRNEFEPEKKGQSRREGIFIFIFISQYPPVLVIDNKLNEPSPSQVCFCPRGHLVGNPPS